MWNSWTPLTCSYVTHVHCPPNKSYSLLSYCMFFPDSTSAVTVLASPSTDITEGVALRLTCCSPLTQPGAHFRWYQNTSTTPRQTGQMWNISEVTSEDSGSYYCQMQSGDKVQNSTIMEIDVQCKWGWHWWLQEESNKIAAVWFTKTKPLCTHLQIHTWDYLNSLKCFKSSQCLLGMICVLKSGGIHLWPLCFLDSPRNTAVSVRHSGKQEEGLPVTFTCSSDANPPVHTYTWYQGEACLPTTDKSFHQGRQSLATPTGRGKTLSSVNITADDCGQHCCVARNRHGSQTCSVTLECSTGRFIKLQFSLTAIFHPQLCSKQCGSNICVYRILLDWAVCMKCTAGIEKTLKKNSFI